MIALQMSIPVVGSLFLVDVALGIARTNGSTTKYICCWDSM